mmetsp:Transcript_9030/g.26617  ORF Transcript_9030/g.26617 Transcript_9030/m.26617 type:complete len:123 (-) Transcript_9030:144-512(-)
MDHGQVLLSETTGARRATHALQLLPVPTQARTLPDAGQAQLGEPAGPRHWRKQGQGWFLGQVQRRAHAARGPDGATLAELAAVPRAAAEPAGSSAIGPPGGSAPRGARSWSSGSATPFLRAQ